MSDRSIFEAINGLNGGAALDTLTQLAANSRLGFLAGAALLAGLVVWRRNQHTLRLTLILVLSVAFADLLCGQVFKPLFASLRPCHQWPATVQLHGTLCGGAFGFPSNHAANNAALVTAMFTLVPRSVTAAFALLAVFIAWSRIYVGAHFPSDVLAGLALGAVVGWAVRTLVLRAAVRLQRT